MFAWETWLLPSWKLYLPEMASWFTFYNYLNCVAQEVPYELFGSKHACLDILGFTLRFLSPSFLLSFPLPPSPPPFFLSSSLCPSLSLSLLFIPSFFLFLVFLPNSLFWLGFACSGSLLRSSLVLIFTSHANKTSTGSNHDWWVGFMVWPLDNL